MHPPSWMGYIPSMMVRMPVFLHCDMTNYVSTTALQDPLEWETPSRRRPRSLSDSSDQNLPPSQRQRFETDIDGQGIGYGSSVAALSQSPAEPTPLYDLSASHADTTLINMSTTGPMTRKGDCDASLQEILNDASIPAIDITIACAGVHDFTDDRLLTTDGLEWHFGVNHLAHFLFVNDLLPKIRTAAKSNPPGSTRIIAVSSEMAFASPFRFSDPQFDEKPIPDSEKPNWEFMKILKVEPHTKYDHWIAYSQSKTANVLFALHLNKILAEDNITAFSLHPGLVQSQYAMHFFENGLSDELKEVFASIAGTMKTVEQGAATAVVAALDPGLKPEAGTYLSDCQIKSELPEYLTSTEQAEKLWELSEEILKEKLT